MNFSRILIAVTALLLTVGPAAAQTQTSEAEVSEKLQAAERRMAEAAREIAALTEQRLPQMREFERRIEIMNDDRPRLGVNIGEVNANGPVEGVLIVGVTPGSAAEDAGLRSGDVITSINDDSLSADQPGESIRRVLDFMDGVEAGDVLTVEYLRDGKVGSVEVEPRPVEMHAYSWGGEHKEFHVPAMPEMLIAPEMVEKFRQSFRFSWPGNVWGDMELIELNEGLGKYFGTDSGVLVVSAPESNALQLEDGDVIRKIDGREPTSVRHAMRILSSYQAGETLKLEILRDKKSRTLEIEMPDDRSSMLFQAPLPVRPAAAPRPPRPAAPSERT